MKELLRSNDMAEISWVEATMKAERIEVLVLDTHASVMDGSLVAIPRRIMVIDEDFDRARQLLLDAESSRMEANNQND